MKLTKKESSNIDITTQEMFATEPLTAARHGYVTGR